MHSPSEVKLSWMRQDFEQRLAFPGGRWTQVNNWLAALMGGGLTVVFYLCLLPFGDSRFAEAFTLKPVVPAAICFLSSWALALLFIKSRKLRFQRKSLDHVVVPQDHDFVLSSATADTVVDNIYTTVDDPKYFVLFNRIVIALSNLRNLGRVADVDDILRSQSTHDESSMETSYAVVSGFVWAIPVLGFIGTVLGLSMAIGGFSDVLMAASEIEEIKTNLTHVTKGLGTAFETTLQGLVAALCIQLILTFVKKSEEDFLDACTEYCTRHVVNRLRIMPYQSQVEE